MAKAKKKVAKKTASKKKKAAAKKAPARAAKKKASKKASSKTSKVTKKKTVTKKKKAPAKKKAVTKKKKASTKKKVAAKKKVTTKKKKTAAKKKATPAKKTTQKKKAAPAKAKKTATKKQAADARASEMTAAEKREAKSNAKRAKIMTQSQPVENSQKRPKVVRKLVNLNEISLPAGYRPAAGEEYMNSKHLLYFKRKLEAWQEELIAESEETLEHLRSETRDVGDEAERASRESDNILELRTRDRYRKLLRKIDEALLRIEEGVYGYCEETGEEIGIGRLEARPIATLTVDAQERREMFQRQFRDDR